MTARAGGGDGASFHGAEADLDTLLLKAAESIYKRTQPYRYAVYLMYDLSSQKKTWADAVPILRGLTSDRIRWNVPGPISALAISRATTSGTFLDLRDDFRRALAPIHVRSLRSSISLGMKSISSRGTGAPRRAERGAGSCSRPIRALPSDDGLLSPREPRTDRAIVGRLRRNGQARRARKTTPLGDGRCPLFRAVAAQGRRIRARQARRASESRRAACHAIRGAIARGHCLR